MPGKRYGIHSILLLNRRARDCVAVKPNKPRGGHATNIAVARIAARRSTVSVRNCCRRLACVGGRQQGRMLRLRKGRTSGVCIKMANLVNVARDCRPHNLLQQAHPKQTNEAGVSTTYGGFYLKGSFRKKRERHYFCQQSVQDANANEHVTRKTYSGIKSRPTPPTRLLCPPPLPPLGLTGRG